MVTIVASALPPKRVKPRRKLVKIIREQAWSERRARGNNDYLSQEGFPESGQFREAV
jgi:hypothetical protein